MRVTPVMVLSRRRVKVDVIQWANWYGSAGRKIGEGVRSVVV